MPRCPRCQGILLGRTQDSDPSCLACGEVVYRLVAERRLVALTRAWLAAHRRPGRRPRPRPGEVACPS